MLLKAMPFCNTVYQKPALCLPQLCISVLIFVLLCRSLGLDTRVVLNFDISPLKPTNEDLAAALGSAKLTNKALASALGSVKTEESSQKGAQVFLHFFCLGDRLISYQCWPL
jgi:hypothetical protein